MNEGLQLALPNNSRFLEFEPKLRLAELALVVLRRDPSEIGDSGALRARAAEAISEKRFVDAVQLLVDAEAAGKRVKNLAAIYSSQFDLGTLLYERCLR